MRIWDVYLSIARLLLLLLVFISFANDFRYVLYASKGVPGSF